MVDYIKANPPEKIDGEQTGLRRSAGLAAKSHGGINLVKFKLSESFIAVKYLEDLRHFVAFWQCCGLWVVGCRSSLSCHE